MVNLQSTDDADKNRFEQWAHRAIREPGDVYQAMFYVATIYFLLIALFPFYWLFIVALTPRDELFGLSLMPRGFNIEAFVQVFDVVPFHFYMFNSLVIATVTTAIVLFLGSLAGYAFGRLEFRGRRSLMLLVLVVSYFPPAAFLIPLFNLFTGNVSLVIGGYTIISSPNLFNTAGSLIVPYSALFMPLTIFILTTFYSQVPDGLEDAARVEGSTRLGALFRVIAPLSAPGLATAGVLTFIAVYNEFFFAFLMNDGQAQHWATIVGGITRYQMQYANMYNLMAAASIIGVIPIAVLVVVAQEKIISGLTGGGLKQ